MSVYKYSNWSFGDVESVLNALGEDVALGLKAGELTVERVGNTLQIKEAVKTLFDRHGRCIPTQGFKASVRDPNRDFHLVQPELDYVFRRAKFCDNGFNLAIAAVDDFCVRSAELMEKLSNNSQLSNILNGVHLPVLIPQVDVIDLGTITEEFVGLASKSYGREFPDRKFTNYRKGELEGQVSIVDESRYKLLLERMAEEPVIGIYFPNPFQGFSVLAQREQMDSLPDGFILSGPLDTAIGWAMYPDVLGRDFHTPVNDCSAVNWLSDDYSLCFYANDGGADFDDRANLGYAYENYSGGLLFLG